MRAPRVTRQISYLYSVSVHTLLSKSRVTVATVSLNLPASSSKVVANGGTYTDSILDVPPEENVKGSRGQATEVAK
jgi:hypothetical protein